MLIRADARGETSTSLMMKDVDVMMGDEGSEDGMLRVVFYDLDVRDEDFEDDVEEVVKKRLFDAKRKAF